MRRGLSILSLWIAIAAAPARAQFFGGGPQGDRASFSLCAGGPCSPGVNLANPWIATAASQITKCYIAAQVAPIGAPLTVDVLKAGFGSIFNAPLALPDGSAGVISTKSFSTAARLAENDVLTISILSIGSTRAGQGVTVTCKIQN